MRDIERLLDGAAMALISGDTGEALLQLSRAEKKIRRSQGDGSAGIKERLDRLANLARAAAQGIADARELISEAAVSAKTVTTYDRCGDANNVRSTRPALGRF